MTQEIEHKLLELAQIKEGEDDGSGAGTFKPSGLGLEGQNAGATDETEYMAINRHQLEQQGHRKLAKVNAREKQPSTDNGSPNLGQGLKEHPLLKSQRFDGIDTTVNPVPALSSEARREYDNIRREQELQKQMRLGNAPQQGQSAAPKPTR